MTFGAIIAVLIYMCNMRHLSMSFAFRLDIDVFSRSVLVQCRENHYLTCSGVLCMFSVEWNQYQVYFLLLFIFLITTYHSCMSLGMCVKGFSWSQLSSLKISKPLKCITYKLSCWYLRLVCQKPSDCTVLLCMYCVCLCLVQLFAYCWNFMLVFLFLFYI